MNKKKIMFLSLVTIAFTSFIVYNSGVFDSDEVKEEKLKTKQLEKIEKTKFATLPRITFDELDNKIKSKQDFIIYFGWTVECGDARLFQLNSFDKYLTDDFLKNNKIYVVDLDKEAPDALNRVEMRKPITKRFLIDTWTKDKTVSPMSLKSPQLIHYKNGEIVDLVSWTVVNSDSVYGMREDFTKKFFDNLEKK